jgi:hypothetical protein
MSRHEKRGNRHMPLTCIWYTSCWNGADIEVNREMRDWPQELEKWDEAGE